MRFNAMIVLMLVMAIGCGGVTVTASEVDGRNRPDMFERAGNALVPPRPQLTVTEPSRQRVAQAPALLGACNPALVSPEECRSVKNNVQGKLLVSLFIDGVPVPLEEEGPGSAPRLIPGGYTPVALPECKQYNNIGGCIRSYDGELVGMLIMPTPGESRVEAMKNASPSPNPQTRQCFHKPLTTYADDANKDDSIEPYDVIRGKCPDEFVPDLAQD